VVAWGGVSASAEISASAWVWEWLLPLLWLKEWL
jgi:hypothetical protein